MGARSRDRGRAQRPRPTASRAPDSTESEISTPTTTAAASAKACALVVTVIDPRKHPVASAPIRLELIDGDREIGNEKTDEQGRHVFDALAAGSYRLVVYDARFRTRRTDAIECRGEPLTVGIELEEGLVIAGRVRDESGTPIAEATVGSSGEARATITTDDQGRFELTGLDPGAINVFAFAPGYAARQMRGLSPGARNVDIRLERPARVQGSVDLGSSTKSALVSVCQYDTYFSKEICVARRVVQTPEKLFSIGDLPSGSYDVVYEAEGFRTERVRVVLQPGKEISLRPVVLNVGPQTN